MPCNCEAFILIMLIYLPCLQILFWLDYTAYIAVSGVVILL